MPSRTSPGAFVTVTAGKRSRLPSSLHESRAIKHCVLVYLGVEGDGVSGEAALHHHAPDAAAGGSAVLLQHALARRQHLPRESNHAPCKPVNQK
eukprot:1195374-Prorocentrum_minimum.AAC.7